MPAARHVLAIDQGTTGSRAILFDAEGRALAESRRELPQVYPRPGWVEHDPEEIWRATVAVCREALARAGTAAAGRLAAIGITNQRETTVLWDRETGAPVHNALVWQDRRTAEACAQLAAAGHEADIQARTGLLLDPYFSATKLAWLLDNVAGARAAAARGRLAFGTIDSFLLWRLTSGRVHATSATNAARTMLFDIHRQVWDKALLELFGVPTAVLPEVRDDAADFGATTPDILGRSLPVTAMAGDQQAALVGQACLTPGMIKSTYGTGCFVLVNTGAEAVRSRNRLLTTLAYRIGGVPCYALEGSIFAAGAAVQWLRDGLGIIAAAAETEALAAGLADNRGVYMVPAFTGLGAPHWDADARGALFGLTRATGPAELARAALESVCYQTRDLLAAMAADGAAAPAVLRVDGGMVANDWLMQFLADLLDLRVERPALAETTALGAARLAALGAGLLGSLAESAAAWQPQASFTPALAPDTRARLLAGWDDAVARVRGAGGGQFRGSTIPSATR